VSALVIGIDPGLSGAIAVLSEIGDVEYLDDLPIVRDRRLSWIDGAALQSLLMDTLAGRPARAVVERVGAMPGQGVVSSFTFGLALGSVLAVLQARHIPIELVPAAVWKGALGLGRDKKGSLDKARLLYPRADLDLAKHHGRAEALLLAHFDRCRGSGG